MKGYLKSAVMAGALFGLFMGLFMGLFLSLFRGFMFGFYGGITAGLISGSLFGLTMAIFMSIQGKKFKKLSMAITNGKKVIKEDGANHFKGAEGVGGWLILTEDEVIFESHKLNIQVHNTVIPLSEIVEVRAVLTARIIPNGLLIVSKNGAINKFVVNERKVWEQKINDAISSKDK